MSLPILYAVGHVLRLSSMKQTPGTHWHVQCYSEILLLLGLSGFYPLHPMMITNAERLRRKRAREVLLASQKTESEPGETEAS